MQQHNEPKILGEIPAEESGLTIRYLGYADGVYSQRVWPDGQVGRVEPYECYSMWPRSAAALRIAAASVLNLEEQL